ncbi:putative splicing factor 3B subunit 5/RDS3 complex subunit 10 [Helianthus annuus]|nr:putative splicing factor 3B subunit 5/RDS3 complex subunit 10 [Helianthus annuus]
MFKYYCFLLVFCSHLIGAVFLHWHLCYDALNCLNRFYSSKQRIICASDRFNINSQLEHLQAKYVGTGHADMSRFEWAVNIQRDSYASYVGHYPMLAYFAIAENESIGRERYNFMQVFFIHQLQYRECSLFSK